MGSDGVNGFFAYPSAPKHVSEILKSAIAEINSAFTGTVTLRSWDEYGGGGTFLIDEICRGIDKSQLFLADLTGTNPNVMFELGYAVARDKRIWVVLDTTWGTSKRDYDQLELLTGIGYISYTNSRAVVSSFFRDAPYRDLNKTVLATAIKPLLQPGENQHLLYLKNAYPTEADWRLSEVVDRYSSKGLHSVIGDPNEVRAQTLAWYAQQVYSATGVLVHFCVNRERCSIHNARYAFVAGMAHGFGKRLLMLAEDDYKPPFDYRHLLIRYARAAECIDHGTRFLDELLAERPPRAEELVAHRRVLEFEVELRGLRIGDHVAENEVDWLQEYFIETIPYQEVISGQRMVFVGRKGSGKTANFLQAAARLREDKRNLVITVQPVGYDLDGLTRLLRKYRQRDAKGYLVESLWKFLLYSEIAKVATENFEARPLGLIPAETRLVEFTSENPLIREDFPVRVERVLESLLSLSEYDKVEDNRVAISEAIHSRLLARMRSVLGQALHPRNRLAILIDNLDRAWNRESDLDNLSDLLFGLLNVANDLREDFARSDQRVVKATVAIFLRSDIFAYLREYIREPDKLSFSRIEWRDPELLIRIVQERLVAAQRHVASRDDVWRRFFAPNVRSVPSESYLAARVLPRPRDIIYFSRQAIATAITRGHGRVEEPDILDAERQYSQYALETLQVEGESMIPRLDNILYGFVGANEILSRSEIEQVLVKADADRSLFDLTIEHLTFLGFLGLEVDDDCFKFAIDEEDMKIIAPLARRLSEGRGGVPRYRINIPYQTYLEIKVG